MIPIDIMCYGALDCKFQEARIRPHSSLHITLDRVTHSIYSGNIRGTAINKDLKE